MPDLTDVSILDFPTAVTLSASDILYLGVVAPLDPLGYDDAKVTLSDLANAFVNSFYYTQDLKTQNKTITGAINEIGFIEFDSTLLTGATTVTISDEAITTSSVIDVYVDSSVPIPYESLVVTESGGVSTITITFEAQESDLSVKVRVY